MSTIQLVRLPHFPGAADLPALFRGSEFAAGLDLVSAVSISIRPGERVMIPTGIKIAMPEGMEAQVRPRSGQAIKKGLTVINSPGTVDADFRGEIMVLAYNANPVIPASLWGSLLEAIGSNSDSDTDLLKGFSDALEDNTVRIAVGDRIAQMVFGTFETPTIEEVGELDDTVRGAAGYGSSGGMST